MVAAKRVVARSVKWRAAVFLEPFFCILSMDLDEAYVEEEELRMVNDKCGELSKMEKYCQDAAFENENYQGSETDEEYESDQKMIRDEEERVYYAAMENEGTLGEPCISVCVRFGSMTVKLKRVLTIAFGSPI